MTIDILYIALHVHFTEKIEIKCWGDSIPSAIWVPTCQWIDINMLDMCNYFFCNFLKSYKMSVAKVKVAQNRHVWDHSERKLSWLCSIHILYSLR